MSVLDLITQTETDEQPLSQQERETIQAALWRLLEKRIKYDTLGDSSSVPVERAEALLESLCYTMLLHIRERRLPRKALLEPDALLDDAFGTIEQLLVRARGLYLIACGVEPPVPSIAWRDTLRGIGVFFKRYDYRILAHEIPGDIDYPLCVPVSETLLGVSYILEYLRRFLHEAELYGALDKRLQSQLLHRFSPDPEGLLINLYEPIMANAVGATLCGLSARALNAPHENQRELAKALATLDGSAIRKKLAHAASLAADELGLGGDAARYFTDAAAWLAPRLIAALGADDLSHVFVSLF